ncbi:heme oxygenase (biliverdin-producing) [Demequina mangrovi]|uniref:Heme oxygenase n=1 Tax=Demequina mangrovi TaxID=1043493 RepID=A0A1H6ZGL6_9MICO|nr:biliverdin-producing heme oxygenase [Demequina mangrovi]SEJ52458.1 heme oxygenase [Demequina mangrovi]
MTTPESPDGLASRLRDATAPEHRDTENRGFITRLMGGELDLAAYVRYLAQYTHVYRALEARAAQPGDPGFLADEALRRVPSMESDLVALGAADWEAAHAPLPATQAYVDHLHAIAAQDVPRYVAHHYTRYLGDLSGGQAIAKLVARHYGATDAQLGFYRFEEIDSPVRYKRAYREQLDALDLDAEQEAVLIAEAKSAFHLNGAIFDALGAAEPLAA